ncbi:MAG: TIGR00289 family protein [Candidatus Aenigmatarchaeota archaeon]|nr:MAG: TIGR00289 family protein [Candidatus Aenigmarchaeota archaeon]
MGYAALFSGGKDSTYTLYLALRNGYEVTYLISMISENVESYMYHTPNMHLVELLAESIGIKLVKGWTRGEKEKEVDDLRAVLEKLGVEGVVVGAIASKYQKERVERVCETLGLKMYAPLWGVNVDDYMEDLVKRFEVMITAVGAEGLGREWLGRILDKDALEELKKLREIYGIHIAGEGGEYETLVLNGPIFRKRLVVEDYDVVWEGNSGYLKIKKAVLV